MPTTPLKRIQLTNSLQGSLVNMYPSLLIRRSNIIALVVAAISAEWRGPWLVSEKNQQEYLLVSVAGGETKYLSRFFLASQSEGDNCCMDGKYLVPIK